MNASRGARFGRARKFEASGLEFARQRRLDAKKSSQGWSADKNSTAETSCRKLTARYELVGSRAANTQKLRRLKNAVHKTQIRVSHDDLGTP